MTVLNAGFVVNSSAVGNASNSIGMTSAAWQGCFACNTPLGTCTMISQGGPYDQFAAFRSSTVASLTALAGTNCSWIGNTYTGKRCRLKRSCRLQFKRASSCPGLSFLRLVLASQACPVTECSPQDNLHAMSTRKMQKRGAAESRTCA